MADQNNDKLQSRIDKLEQRVRELEQRIENKETQQPSQSRVLKELLSETNSQQSAPKSSRPINFQLGEEWLNRIGIGLLLVGVAFLFKYSIDQGWLIPPIRSAIGLGIGVVLFVGGLKLNAGDNPLKQILLGGGIGAFYITGFATFQLYSFLPGVIIWSFMIVVTLLALSLSLQQDEAVLSIIGALGALGTPFMLHSGGGSVPMLIAYLILVLAGTAVVYMKKGWQSLLWTIALGGVSVIIVGIVEVTFNQQTSITQIQQWSLQAGVVVWVLVSWLLPVFRETQRVNNLYNGENLSNLTPSSVHLMVFLIPLLMLIVCHGIWDLSMNQAGLLAVGIAVLGSGFYIPLKNRGLPKLSASHALLGLVMGTIGIFLLVDGNFLFTVLVAEMVALRYVSRQTGDTRISVSSHILFVIVAYWLLNTLFYGSPSELSLWGIESISQLIFIAAGGLLVPVWLKKNDLKQVYQIGSHILFLIWLYQKISIFEDGQAWVTISWGVYAIILLVLGFVRYRQSVRLVGMATIFLVVGKLFLVDLSQLQAIWRILLFMGFGAVLLILGYYSQSRWQANDQS